MTKGVADLQTGKVKFPKPSEKGTTTTVIEGQYVLLPQATADKLAKLAKQDGFTPDAESPKGKQIQTSRAIKTYVLMAIDMLFAKRGV